MFKSHFSKISKSIIQLLKITGQLKIAGLNEIQIKSLINLINQSRSPGLFRFEDDFLTERLLAHPVKLPMQSLNLKTSPAIDNKDRILIADRLLSAYDKAAINKPPSNLIRNGDDLWSNLIRDELSDLLEIIESRNASKLADYLLYFGNSYLAFGGISTCVDGYNKNQKPDHIALTYFDKLICLAEYLGLLPHENPEAGNWGENLLLDINEISHKLQEYLGIKIEPPLGAIHTDGVATNNGIFHYRHINSLYAAIRLKELNPMNGPSLEFGGGLGITALYASRLGIKDYTLLDLPITLLLAGNYLLNALGPDSNFISLYGEPRSENQIKLLPYWECVNLSPNSFRVTINQDSFPEIADNLLEVFFEKIKILTKGYFISINHECCYPRTVNNFVNNWTNFRKVYRSKYWIREGYIEELWEIQ